MFVYLIFLAFSIKHRANRDSYINLNVDPQVKVGFGMKETVYSIIEAEKAVNESDKTEIVIKDSTAPITMSIKPKNSVIELNVQKLSGTMYIYREHCVIMPSQNIDLRLKINASGKKQYDYLYMVDKNLSVPLFLMNEQAGLESVDIEFTDLDGINEFDLMVYSEYVSKFKINPLNKDYTFDLKTKEVTKDYNIAAPGSKVFMDYYEIKKIEQQNQPATPYVPTYYLPIGGIVGIVIACLVVFIALSVGAAFLFRRKKLKVAN